MLITRKERIRNRQRRLQSGFMLQQLAVRTCDLISILTVFPVRETEAQYWGLNLVVPLNSKNVCCCAIALHCKDHLKYLIMFPAAAYHTDDIVHFGNLNKIP